jgi:hypothetical protein
MYLYLVTAPFRGTSREPNLKHGENPVLRHRGRLCNAKGQERVNRFYDFIPTMPSLVLSNGLCSTGQPTPD